MLTKQQLSRDLECLNLLLGHKQHAGLGFALQNRHYQSNYRWLVTRLVFQLETQMAQMAWLIR